MAENAACWASATSISIILEQKSAELRLIVEDDGRGFDHAAEPPEDGTVRARLGLSGIRERLALLGGAFHLETTPGAGTTAYVQIPIPAVGPT